MIENITLFTDASFCTHTRAGGAAFWARTGSTFYKEGFAIDAACSGGAELLAALHAFDRLYRHPVIGPELRQGPSRRLVLVTDCLAVKQVLEGAANRLTARPEIATLLSKLQRAQAEHQFWLKVNHVKAHAGVWEPRQWCNAWCDKESRRVMREVRDGRLAAAH
jgi:ribonuclease HI